MSSLPFHDLDDNEFQIALFEFANGVSIRYDPDRLASLKFNPLLCESYKNFSLCKDLNPDSNFFNEIGSCEYYSEDSFNNMLSEEQNRLNLNSIDVSLLHLNIRSIRNKLDKFTNFLGALKTKFPVVGITETWLDDCYHCSDIQGYTFLNNYRVGRSGGGVGLYLVDNVSFKQRNDLAFSDNSATESLFVELDRAKEKTSLSVSSIDCLIKRLRTFCVT